MHTCIAHRQTIVPGTPGEVAGARWRGSVDGKKGGKSVILSPIKIINF